MFAEGVQLFVIHDQYPFYSRRQEIFIRIKLYSVKFIRIFILIKAPSRIIPDSRQEGIASFFFDLIGMWSSRDTWSFFIKHCCARERKISIVKRSSGILYGNVMTANRDESIKSDRSIIQAAPFVRNNIRRADRGP